MALLPPGPIPYRCSRTSSKTGNSDWPSTNTPSSTAKGPPPSKAFYFPKPPALLVGMILKTPQPSSVP